MWRTSRESAGQGAQAPVLINGMHTIGKRASLLLPSLVMSLSPLGFDDVSWITTLSVIGLIIFAVHLVPYLIDTHGVRSIPGPWLAKFTDAWLGRVAAGGHRSEVVHELHKQYGEFPPMSLSYTPPPLHPFLGTDHAPPPFFQERLSDLPQTTCQSPTQTPFESSTLMGTDV